MVIECLPFDAFIERYDRKATLFYLDPPYWGSEDDYGKNLFTSGNFERLAAILLPLIGRFILSLNEVSEVRELFAGVGLEEVETTYTLAGGKGAKRIVELIISNMGLTT